MSARARKEFDRIVGKKLDVTFGLLCLLVLAFVAGWLMHAWFGR